MKRNLFAERLRMRVGSTLPVMAAFALTSVVVIRSSDSHAEVVPTYSIEFHTISAGGNALRNSCFGLSGTVGQAAPGYSNTSDGTTYSIYSGFWSAATATGLDEILFAGFEGC